MKKIISLVLLTALAACSNQKKSEPVVTSETVAASVSYEFFRNATAKLNYNGQTFLLDPMLSPKHALPSFAGVQPNPTVELPKSIDYILEGIDAVIVGHMHPDHFDSAAAEVLSKNVLIFTPYNKSPMDPRDPVNTTKYFSEQLLGYGFSNVNTIGTANSKSTTYRGTTLTQEFGQHGKGVLSQLMGGVNGIVFQAEGQPTIYWTGDTILDEAGQVEAILATYKPDIVIAHTGGAVIKAITTDPLMMDEKQAVKFFKAVKKYNVDSQIVAVHMNALDHCFTTREVLTEAISVFDKKTQSGIYIPVEGEKITF